jgi:predicted DNA binding CopG/RHH family protein
MNRNNITLDKEESEILSSFENEEWKSVKDLSNEISKFKNAAKATINKNKRINIRITEKDFDMIQIKAIEEGIPYQTLISSLIHRYLSGKVIDKDQLILHK